MLEPDPDEPPTFWKIEEDEIDSRIWSIELAEVEEKVRFLEENLELAFKAEDAIRAISLKHALLEFRQVSVGIKNRIIGVNERRRAWDIAQGLIE